MDESNSAQELLQIFKSFRKAFIPPLPPPPANSLLQEEQLFFRKNLGTLLAYVYVIVLYDMSCFITERPKRKTKV